MPRPALVCKNRLPGASNAGEAVFWSCSGFDRTRHSWTVRPQAPPSWLDSAPMK